MSKGHGPLALYAILGLEGILSGESELTKFLEWDGILGGHPDRKREYRESKPQPDHWGTVFPWPSGWLWGLRPKRSIAASMS